MEGDGPWTWKRHDATNFTGRGNCIYTSEGEEGSSSRVDIISCRAARTGQIREGTAAQSISFESQPRAAAMSMAVSQ